MRRSWVVVALGWSGCASQSTVAPSDQDTGTARAVCSEAPRGGPAWVDQESEADESPVLRWFAEGDTIPMDELTAAEGGELWSHILEIGLSGVSFDPYNQPGTLHDQDAAGNRVDYPCWDECRMVETMFIWAVSQRFSCLTSSATCANMADPLYFGYSSSTEAQICAGPCS